MAKSITYDAGSISVLEGLEAVRKRPGMYIGSVSRKGLNHLIYEIVDNAVDEHLAGHCDRIEVTLEKDGSATVNDNGRGIPVGMHEKGMSAERLVFTTLHAGGKFDNTVYKTSGGLHGVGSSVVNALSVYLEIKVSREGAVHYDRYERGVPTVELENGLLPVIGRTKKTGTWINFLPDPEIFEKTRFAAAEVKSRLHETAYLNPNLVIVFEDKRDGTTEHIEFHEPDGIIGYVKDLNKKKETIHEPVYFKGESEGITVECAFQYVNEFHENVLGFCNNIYNAEGGTHLTGFKTVFTTVMNTYARELGILKEKDANFTGADIRNGLTAVISVKHPAPRFEGQTKTKLDNQDASKASGKVTGEEVVLYFDRNLETLKSVLSCAEKAAKIRRSEEKAKTNMLTKQKYSFDSNGKLANCESRDASKCEIFIVEGDSAGGSAKTARNRNFQAILPIRGKILNVEKASIDKVLANAEIKTMINAFGCGFSEGYGNDFDITKLRYDKIIIMADADVDGAHISTLLLTLFYRFMPDLIYEGHVYIAMPPLYKAMPSKGEEEYLYDDKALERYRKAHKGSFTLQRYKGLGEMDADQLWETTLNPETRIMKRVEIEDARMASDVTEMLMGTEVPPRKAFIYEHAQDAELDV
ncbi:MAG: DNA gyrase subunit B [Lachnospiraceae bacterium]|jgi:DNA gyrase subunit B|uniref:DNA gyrase subunit B n=1 Tax=Hominisplanchenecus murintestinalis TaxID=2941517 RepID=A0AC61QWV2_9FIRM|nr:DNA gyrase subunit B [Hominisplanchenecus murintestinalis]MCI9516820.1 DNA gyrase subunit B [Lachnospiraceae bacterium]RKJ85374.1 DNA gyrase subunit B [Anaerotruncus sp. 1XD22-93]MCI9661372.1 DNA gyrase subunit B [Lachnospiraceae bacterium]NBH98769.1 DNA gyrase subunit B [Lachnospiraceae bacterium]NBI75999.1 DNA gyrase subunit B [Lachnospiraceae bacterium]